jgi:DNA-binding MarR family transcriptional regulator
MCYGLGMAPEDPSQVSARERATNAPGDASPFALGLLLRRAHDRAAAALVEALRPLGLELRHFAVLIALNSGGTMSQSALVAVVGSDKATMVRVVDDLEAAGLVVRRPYPGDRRIHAVEMTPRGLEIFDAAHVSARPIADRLVAHLGPGEAAELLELLTRFTYPPAPET